MKKNILIFLILSLFVIVLTGCSKDTWPLNENTNGVPEPTFKMVEYIKTEGNMTTAMYHNVSLKKAKEYVVELENANFVTDIKENETAKNYYFGAKNSETKIHISFNRNPFGTVTIACKKYK